jgi:SAM-dependent methyltransferase
MNRSDPNPGMLLEMSGYYWKTCTLHAGVKLDVFTVIGEESMSGEAVARQLNGNADGVVRLLNALTALDLLNHSDGRYSNTVLGRTFLSKDSPRYVGFMIMHHHHLVESWSHLDQAVLSGKAVRSRISFSDPEVRESFLMGMFNLAMGIAPTLVPKIDLSGKRRLLDLGGGPGTYAIHFCKHNPDLAATVFDLPTTEPFARKTIGKFELSHRIDFIGGDYIEDDIPGAYDVVWLSHILHGEGPENCRKLMKKAASALNPGGLIIVHEFILNPAHDGPLFATLFSLNMLLGTENGRAYSEPEISAMLTEVGAGNIRRIPVETPNDSGIIMGEM